MPDLGASAIIGIISAIIGGAGLGESLFAMANAPGPPKPAPITGPNKAQQGLLKEAAAQELPSVQDRLGGSVSPDYFLSQLTSNPSLNVPGASGTLQAAVNAYTGTGGSGGPSGGGGGTSGFTPAGVNPSSPQQSDVGLSDFWKQLNT